MVAWKCGKQNIFFRRSAPWVTRMILKEIQLFFSFSVSLATNLVSWGGRGGNERGVNDVCKKTRRLDNSVVSGQTNEHQVHSSPVIHSTVPFQFHTTLSTRRLQHHDATCENAVETVLWPAVSSHSTPDTKSSQVKLTPARDAIVDRVRGVCGRFQCRGNPLPTVLGLLQK